MFSKFNFWIIFIVILLFAGLWLFEPNDADIGPDNLFSSKEKTIVSKNEMKKANQKEKQSLEKKIVKTIKLDRMLSPDELYDQQFDSGQAEFELEPTIPEIEVMPEELKVIEQEAEISSETFDVDALSENPDQTEILMEDESPPSENYKEVIPFELEQMESNFDSFVDN